LNFDISPDGKRVIMFPQSAAETSTGNLHATFLLNFFDELPGEGAAPQIIVSYCAKEMNSNV
jgi:hypothetical protein